MMLVKSFCLVICLAVVRVQSETPEEKCPKKDYDHLEILERSSFNDKLPQGLKYAPISVSNAQVLVRFEDLVKPPILQPNKVPYVLVPFTGDLPQFSDFYLPLSKAFESPKPAPVVEKPVEKEILVRPLPTTPELFLVDNKAPVLKDTLDEDYITRVNRVTHPNILPQVVYQNVSHLLEDCLAPVSCATCKAAPKILVTYPIIPPTLPQNLPHNLPQHLPQYLPQYLPPITIPNCGCTKRVQDEDQLFGFNGNPINLCNCIYCQNPRTPRKFLNDIDNLEVFTPPSVGSFQQYTSTSSSQYLEDPEKIVYYNKPTSYSYIEGNYPQGRVRQNIYEAPKEVTLINKPQQCYKVIPRYDIIPRYNIRPVAPPSGRCTCGDSRCTCGSCAKYTRELDFY